jgi:hypothetical protein
VEGNLDRALSEEPRPDAERKLTGKEEAHLIHSGSLVCFDETPVQLIGEMRQPIPAEPGKRERYDYGHRRNGTVNLFVAFDPHRVWRKVALASIAMFTTDKARAKIGRAYPDTPKGSKSL